ncbi:MAG: hypothetical protein ACYTDT_08500 [Planctomycetota bacterium]
MNTRLTFCALALLAIAFATQASAESRGYRAHTTTVLELAEHADVIVVGQLDRVENIEIEEQGMDAAANKRVGDGSFKDGQDNIRREAIINVTQSLKGSYVAGDEVRVVSMRQLKEAAYDIDLRDGEALYFIGPRAADGRLVVFSDERGTVSAGEVGGDLNAATDLVKDFLQADKQAMVDRLLEMVTLDGSRLSVDACIEMSWSHGDYDLNETQKQHIAQLLVASASNSKERNQLLTAVGRHAPEGAMNTLLTVMFSDSAWSTTSLGAMSLEYVGRGQAITELLNRFDNASDDEERMVAIRALGLIRPKAGHDGAEVRTRTLDAIKSLLSADTDKDLLREALIASRDMRSQDAHIAELKTLIDNRVTNGLSIAETQAAVIALAAAQVIHPRAEGPDLRVSIEKEYLEEVAEADPILGQTIKSALLSPFTNLIAGADGRGH